MSLQISIEVRQYKGYNKMTKKRIELIKNIIYYTRYVLFIIHNFMVFQLLYIILRMKAYGIIFLILELIYIVIIITQLLGAKLRYKKDVIYNCMQIGFYLYLFLFFIKIKTNFITPSLSFVFLRNNFIVLSILLLIIMLYSKIIVNKRQEKLN